MKKSEYLEKLQSTEVEILDEIVRICEEYDLKYYLIGGTLLGAVRHKGFIPWDDDLDIVMPREDFDKFCELCKNELSDDYYLHTINSDERYWLIHAKVRKNNTIFDEKPISTLNDMHKGIYVDIFPLDDAKCIMSKKQKIRTISIKKISSLIYRKRRLNLKFRALVKVASFFLPFSIKRLTKWQHKLMTKSNGKGYEYYINYGSNYKTEKQTMLKSVYEPSCKLEFAGKLYNAPGKYEYFLERIYGFDYMQLPPEEKRVTHNPVRISFDINEPDEVLED